MAEQEQTKRKQAAPKQKRAKETYEQLLRAALHIIDQKGIEALNSNAIVEAIGSTPPTFYRYFSDKHEVLEVLGNRLVDLQNNVIITELGRQYEDYETGYKSVYQLLTTVLNLTKETEGSYALLLSLRAIPSLRSIRINSHEKMTEIGTEVVCMNNPDLDRDEVKVQVRLAMEIGYTAIEMLFETNFKNTEQVLNYTTNAILKIFESFIN